jgi:hypothetical protein
MNVAHILRNSKRSSEGDGCKVMTCLTTLLAAAAAYKASKLIEDCQSQVRMRSWRDGLMNLFICVILY